MFPRSMFSRSLRDLVLLADLASLLFFRNVGYYSGDQLWSGKLQEGSLNLVSKHVDWFKGESAWSCLSGDVYIYTEYPSKR